MIKDMKSIIVAYDQNRAIGTHNTLPWAGKMKTDMRRVRELTTGNAIIMGRNTYDSIGRALPNRQNIVITHRPFQQEGVLCVDSLDAAYAAVEAGREAYVFGGAQIYNLALDTVEQIIVTEIGVETIDADTFFPVIDSAMWHEVSRDHYAADAENSYDFDFVTYQRNSQ